MTEINRQTILLQEVVGVVIIVVWVGRVVPGGIFFNGQVRGFKATSMNLWLRACGGRPVQYQMMVIHG
jgi:hypothetical protein